jgi:hypothetical protein
VTRWHPEGGRHDGGRDRAGLQHHTEHNYKHNYNTKPNTEWDEH